MTYSNGPHDLGKLTALRALMIPFSILLSDLTPVLDKIITVGSGLSAALNIVSPHVHTTGKKMVNLTIHVEISM